MLHPNHYSFMKARTQGFSYQQLLSIVLLSDLGLLKKMYVADDPSTFYHFFFSRHEFFKSYIKYLYITHYIYKNF
jgi:hypothetical protein